MKNDVTKLLEEIQQLKERIKELEASQPKWISVDGMLPKEYQKILFVEEDGRVQAGEMWSCGDSRHIFKGRGEHCSENATHWMPFPTAPKSK